MKNFIRKKENFNCANCGWKVAGTGYTNHCPKCLYSKHLDEAVPGDRESGCKGLMTPVRAENHNQEYILVHKCQKCGKETRNKSAKEDNFEEVLKLL